MKVSKAAEIWIGYHKIHSKKKIQPIVIKLSLTNSAKSSDAGTSTK